MKEGKESIMGAALEVTFNGKTQPVIVQQKMSQGNTENMPGTLDGNDRYIFYLTNISVQNESKIGLAVVDNLMPKTDKQPETLVLTASIKPFINLVWGGTIVMVLGFFAAVLNRYRLIKLETKREERVASNNSNGHTNGNGRPKNNLKKKTHTEKV